MAGAHVAIALGAPFDLTIPERLWDRHWVGHLRRDAPEPRHPLLHMAPEMLTRLQALLAGF